MVNYWPEDEKAFTNTSCKKVEALVRLQYSKMTSQRNEVGTCTGQDNETKCKKNQTEEQEQ